MAGEAGVSHGAKPDANAAASATTAARRAARASRGKFGGAFVGKGAGKLGRKSSGPVMVPVSEHGIDARLVAANAMRVTKTLQENGFKAFVVGGAVRDLLLGVKPKDFDVATDAVPEEIQRLFRRAHIIGRRFRLVHVMFGADTIEVSTFRANSVVPVADAQPLVVGPPGKRLGTAQHVSDEHGRVLRDNIFGSQEEDAARRDFTVNALFYDPETQTVIDYHHGVADIKSRTMRMIGDPEQRYREDPVRMLRAVRFAAKLGFTIDEATREPIARLAPLLENVPSARLFDEMLKLLLSGHALACLKRLRAEGLHHGMLPLLDVVLEQPMGERFVTLALENTDERIRVGKPTTPSFLFAALLWHEVLKRWDEGKARGEYPIPALGKAMDDVLDAQTGKLAIQRRYTADMREIWGLQPRLERRVGRAPWRLIEHPRFRAGYDFLLLRGAAGEIDAALGEWWTRFVDAGSAGREALQDELSASDVAGAGAKRKRRKKKKPATEGAAASVDAHVGEDDASASGDDDLDAGEHKETAPAASKRARKPVADGGGRDAEPPSNDDVEARHDADAEHDDDAAYTERIGANEAEPAAAPRKARRRRPRKPPVE
ncbi:MAG: polynucleotide adenylyltransferase PcnB [Burkholderiaceae bacterium]